MSKPKALDAGASPTGREAAGPPPLAGSAPWQLLVDRCACDAGPFRTGAAASWRTDIGAVEAMASEIEASAPGTAVGLAGVVPRPVDGRDGVHALVALATASTGVVASRDRLIEVACAVELAYRATRYHGEISDAFSTGNGAERVASSTGPSNRRHVLEGDWSITEAAVLVANISPVAYRILVRGYGAAQMASIEGRAGESRGALLRAAGALGALIAGVSHSEFDRFWTTIVATTSPAALDADPAFDARQACRWAARRLSADDGGHRRGPEDGLVARVDPYGVVTK